jgi:hypothetical protein
MNSQALKNAQAQQQQSKQPQPQSVKPNRPNGQAGLTTRQASHNALATSAAHLSRLEVGMEQFGDEFADEAAAIVQQGLHDAYTKAGNRIAQVEVPDFLGGQQAESMFSLRSYRTGNNALPTATVEVLPPVS